MSIEDHNKEKPLSMQMEALSWKNPVCFSRLTLKDIPQISKLLMSVWPQHYGNIGCPVFSEDYLYWVLGVPSKNKHILIGAKINGVLVACQSFLYRRVAWQGEPLNAFLNTHGTISPELSLRLRLDCAFQLAKQHVLFKESSPFFDTNCDLIYAFYDLEKSIREVLDKCIKKYFGIERKIYSTFNHFIIIPNQLRNFLIDNPIDKGSLRVKVASEKDSAELVALFNNVPEEPHFIMLMTEDELKHHFFGHPAHRTFVIEHQGTITAFINFYPMDFIKGSTKYTYVIVEFLVSEYGNTAQASALLQEAVAFAEEIGAKGVVFENATYLDKNAYRQIGLVPTLRKMHMSFISKDDSIECLGTFRCDVK